jgi:predicted dehydrogenase
LTVPSPLKIAIIGTGFGQIHAEAFSRDGRCQIAGVCSRSPERAQAAAARWGARPYTQWQELLAAEPWDLLSVATPAPTQAEIAAAVLSQRIPLFLEKPLAPSLEHAEALAHLAVEHAVPTAINFEFAELRTWQEAKRLEQAGRVGKLRHVAVVWQVETYANQHGLDSWKTRHSSGGGALNLFCSHTLYYLEWLLGPIRFLTARLGRAPGDARQGDTLDNLILEMATGVPVVVSIATDAFAGMGHHIQVFGDQGTLRLSNRGGDYASGFTLELATREEPRFRVVCSESDGAKRDEDGRIAPTAGIARRLVDAITGGPPCTPDVHAGLRVQRLMEACRASHAGQRAIEIDEPKGNMSP